MAKPHLSGQKSSLSCPPPSKKQQKKKKKKERKKKEQKQNLMGGGKTLDGVVGYLINQVLKMKTN